MSTNQSGVFPIGGRDIETGAITSRELDRSLLQKAEIVLSPAQILALRASPVEIMQAPGREIVWPLEAYLFLQSGETPYTVAADNFLSIQYAPDSGPMAKFEAVDFLDQVENQLRYRTWLGSNAAIKVDQRRLEIKMLGDAEVTDGDGSILVVVYYRVLSLADF